MIRARRLRGRRGATAVEFAVVGSVFLMLLLLAIETAYQFAVGAALDYGARDAARFGATGQTTDNTRPEQRLDDIIARVLNKTRPLLTFERLTVVTESFATPANSPAAGFAPIAGGQQGTLGNPGDAFAIVRYRLSYDQPLLTPFARILLGRSSLEHSTIMIVKNEPFVQGVGQ
jgi:Flp pilus assembly protein TadG